LFELSQRWLALAGKEMVLQVRHKGAEAPLPMPAAAFRFGDDIIACTNPNKGYQLDPLPVDPRHPDGKHLDFFEFSRRLQLLAGELVTVRVRHENGEEQDLLIPPGFHHTLGLRMHMGHVAAIREDSPAAKAGVQAKDIIEEIMLTDGVTGE